jgi:hypothetical protein
MAIDQDRVDDIKIAIAFTDDLRAAYLQLKAMQTKIERYGAAVSAVMRNVADARSAKFVEIVQLLVSTEDLTRIGALLPAITAFTQEIETNYEDFIE